MDHTNQNHIFRYHWKFHYILSMNSMRNQPLLLTFFSFFLENSFFINKNVKLLPRKVKYLPKGEEVGKDWGTSETAVKFWKSGLGQNDLKEFESKVTSLFLSNFLKNGYFKPPWFYKFFETWNFSSNFHIIQ